MPNSQPITLIGAGIGGLSTALALAKQGQYCQLLEQADQLTEVGAGIQLGPNATRILASWGLLEQIEQVASKPKLLQVNNIQGKPLAQMQLGASFLAKYNAPYLAIHRADLQQILLQQVQQFPQIKLQLDCKVKSIKQDLGQVIISSQKQQITAPVVIGCDGLWSVVRDYVSPSKIEPTTHVAWRGLVAANKVSQTQLLEQITLWMGEKVHVVSYPIRSGSLLNVVVMSQSEMAQYKLKQHQSWDFAATKQQLQQQVIACAPIIEQIVSAGDNWRAWVLYHRPILYRASQYVKARVALLGDAAHPTRPHLAQGAAMAIEDAQGLAHSMLGKTQQQWPQALWEYAKKRSTRNTSIQLRSQLNGCIFQLGQPFSAGRDLAIKIAGEKLLDMPWLYGYNAGDF